MPLISNAQIGDLFSLTYTYREVGDELPMHNHDEATSHIIIVAKGSVMVRVRDGDKVHNSVHDAGTMLDTEPGFPHSVIGLSAGAVTIHIRKKMLTASPPAA